jgi:hypothetical protein
VFHRWKASNSSPAQPVSHSPYNQGVPKQKLKIEHQHVRNSRSIEPQSRSDHEAYGTCESSGSASCSFDRYGALGMCSVVLIMSAYEGLIDNNFEVTLVYIEVNPAFVWSIPAVRKYGLFGWSLES